MAYTTPVCDNSEAVLQSLAVRRNTGVDRRWSTLCLYTCIFLVCWFSVADLVLKALPNAIAIPLRYLPEALSYYLALLVFLHTQRQPKRPFFLAVPALMFLVVGFASALVNNANPLGPISDLRILIRYAAIGYIAYRCPFDRKHISIVIRGIVLLAIIQFAAGAAELMLGPTKTMLRPRTEWVAVNSTTGPVSQPLTGFGWLWGTLDNYNAYGMFAVLISTLALACWIHLRQSWSLVLFFVGAGAVLLSFSRHATAELAVGTLLLLLLNWKKATAHRAAAIVGIGLFGTIAYLQGRSTTTTSDLGAWQDRMATVFAPGVRNADPGDFMRLYLIERVPGRVLAAAPVLGYGPGSASFAVGTNPDHIPLSVADVGRFELLFIADAPWLLILYIYGFAGLCIAAWAFWRIAWRVFRTKRVLPSSSEKMMCDICLLWTCTVILSSWFGLEVISMDVIPIYWLLVGVTLNMIDCTARLRSLSVNELQQAPI